MKTSAILFDLDGTLLDTLEDLSDAVNWALHETRLPPRTTDEVRAFVGNGARFLIERAVGAKGVCADECLDLFLARYAAHSADKTRPYPGILAMLDELRARGVPVGVVSNKPDGAVKTLSARYFGERVALAVGEKPGIARKPAPDSVLAALETLGVDPTDAVYVGDSDVDVQTAHNAGMPCIAVTWGFRPRESLIEAGAGWIADDPAQLLDILP